MTLMQATSLMLPEEVVARLRVRVASGEFADEAEVVNEGLRALEVRDDALESWLRTEVVEAWETHRSDPSSSRSIEAVRSGLLVRYQQANGDRKA